jgi:hypothetical protein
MAPYVDRITPLPTRVLHKLMLDDVILIMMTTMPAVVWS